jgi:SPX domain protein involved in polyphosphate accumulation
MKDLRLEKKFVFGKNKEFFLNKFLLNSNFKILYPSRKINSIYIDTINYNFIRDNIDGISDRKKIRFRWYNSNIKNIFFEIKKKKIL